MSVCGGVWGSGGGGGELAVAVILFFMHACSCFNVAFTLTGNLMGGQE